MQINKMSSMDRKYVCHQEMEDRLRDELNGTDLGLADKGSFLTYVIWCFFSVSRGNISDVCGHLYQIRFNCSLQADKGHVCTKP